MNANPRVSIIIPTFNRAELLKIALLSVREQTFSNWEAIIVDNFSIDKTKQMIEEFQDDRMRLIEYTSPGAIAAARNHGIKLARGEIIAFLDSDDSWLPTKLERSLTAMTPNVGLVAHGLIYLKNGIESQKKLAGPANKANYKALLYEGNCLTTSAILVRKKCLEEVNYFSEDPLDLVSKSRKEKILKGLEGPIHVGSEDYDLWMRLAKHEVKFAFVDEMLGYYNVHENNASSAIGCLLDSQLAILERHFSEIVNPSFWDKVMQRRRKAMIFYSLARRLQDDRKIKPAFHFFWWTFTQWPFLVKLYPASALALMGWSRK